MRSIYAIRLLSEDLRHQGGELGARGPDHQIVEIDPVPSDEAVRLRSKAAVALAEWLDW
jgi:hypothetical protein